MAINITTVQGTSNPDRPNEFTCKVNSNCPRMDKIASALAIMESQVTAKRISAEPLLRSSFQP